MAQFGRRRQRKWRFSDGGNRFDGRQRTARNLGRPYSPAFKYGVRRCKRCGNRVVSSLAHCPYCGQSLLPVYQRLWFWLIIVLVVGVSVFSVVFFTLPAPTTDILHPVQPDTPTVVGAGPDASIKGLSIGTAIDVGGLEIAVISLEDGPPDRNGQPLKVLTIEFINNRSKPVILYATQWMLQRADGTRVDSYIGSTFEGVSITGNFETAYELQAGSRFAGRLYFECDEVIYVVHQPMPLSFDEELYVTWSAPEKSPVEPEE